MKGYQPLKAPVIAFAGGVLSRKLQGRADLQKYQTGLKAAENMVVCVEGGVDKRHGFYFVGKRKYQNRVSRLVPWRIGREDSYILEFAHNCIRFIRLGGFVSIPPGFVHAAGNQAVNVDGVMEVSTTYTEAQLRELKFTTANDILYIFHKDHPEAQLKRIGLYDWQLVNINFTPHPRWTTSGLTAVYHNDTIPADNYIPTPVATYYRISAVLDDGTETLPTPIVTVNADTGHQRCWVALDWNDFVPPAGRTVKKYIVFKGNNGIFGFIGYTSAGTTYYEDRNLAPSYDVVPIGEEYNFDGEYASVGEFYKQRMLYGSPKSAPQEAILSRPLLFDSRYHSSPTQDNDAIKFTLVGRNKHTINHIVEMKKLLIFTDMAEWVLETTGNAAMSAATLNPVIETSYGADPYLSPMPVGSRVLFVKGISNDILDIGYDYVSNTYRADNLTRLARDLFTGASITSWAWSDFPRSLVLACLDTGKILPMTYVRDEEVWAWTRWFTAGKFIDVASVDEIEENAIYAQTERDINGTQTYFIERQANSNSETVSDHIYVDCALTYKDERAYSNLVIAENGGTASFDEEGGSYSVGDIFALVEGDNVYTGSVTSIVGSTITLTSDQFGVNFSALGTQTPSLRKVGKIITGLEHLNGCTVDVLADAKAYKNLPVIDGEVTLPFHATQAHVGLAYDAWIETLNLDVASLAAQYRNKTPSTVVIDLDRSRSVQILAVGSPYDPVFIDQRRGNEGYYAPNHTLDGPYLVPAHAVNAKTLSLKVLSQHPLPLNIRSLVPDIVYDES